MVSTSVVDTDDPTIAVAGRIAFPIVAAFTAFRLVRVNSELSQTQLHLNLEYFTQMSFSLEPTEVAQLKVFLVGIGTMIISMAHLIVMRNVSALFMQIIFFAFDNLLKHVLFLIVSFISGHWTCPKMCFSNQGCSALHYILFQMKL